MAERPGVVTVPEVRELAGGLARDLDTLAREMYEFLVDHLPEIRADEELASLTFASCASNLETSLSMIRHGIPASATEAPVAALEHARQMAARGAEVDATVRFYRLGHAYFYERLSELIVQAIPEPARLAEAARQVSEFTFTYIDAVSTRVSAEHLAERERRQRRAAALRADVVRAVLGGEQTDAVAAERALGFPLRGPLLAFLCWTDGDPAQLERAAAAITDGRRALLLEEGSQTLAGWTTDAPVDGAVVAAAAPEVHVAVGDVGRGIEGFRSSRDRAERARRVAELTAAPAPSLTAYEDVALIDLLARDIPAARSFVRRELGELAADDPSAARARAALLAVTAPRGGLASAARELGLHRNTILQRVRRAEELRGAPAGERPAELWAALLLADTVCANRT